MKKSIIALAVAGALTAPMIAQADATLYGVTQFRAYNAEGENFDYSMAKTRLGVRGEVANDVEGLTTGFQIELGFNGDGDALSSDADTSTPDVRYSNVYLSGDWGTVKAGRQANPADAANNMTDILGAPSAWWAINGDRAGKSVAYVSPSFAGLNVSLVDISDTTDAYVAAVDWSGAGFAVHASVTDVKDTQEHTAFGVSYSIDNLYVAASVEKQEFDVGGAEPQVTTFAASYTMDKVYLAAIYSEKDLDVAGADNLSHVTVGARYALGAKASVGVDYVDFDSAAEAADADNTDMVVLEYTLSF